eukprot:2330352-Rhodomonas_salina.3
MLPLTVCCYLAGTNKAVCCHPAGTNKAVCCYPAGTDKVVCCYSAGTNKAAQLVLKKLYAATRSRTATTPHRTLSNASALQTSRCVLRCGAAKSNAFAPLARTVCMGSGFIAFDSAAIRTGFSRVFSYTRCPRT